MIGKIIGNYQITSELARGGMGAVYLARHQNLPREVVIKSIILPAARPDLQAHLKARFLREAHIQSQLDHPNIVRVHEFFTSAENYFLVMEYVPGMSLQGLLARRGALAVPDALHLFKQALAAIDYAHHFNYAEESGQRHTGVIHRDIKPGNMLIDGRGTFKISDFGIAKLLGSESMTRAGFNPGTVEYMSPEQLSGLELDARSDLYSLGVTLYEMLAGRLPFVRAADGSDSEVRRGHLELPAPPIRQWRSDLPTAIASVVMHSLRKDPNERFQSAGEFLAAVMNSEQAISQGLRSAPMPQPVVAGGPADPTLINQPPPPTTIKTHQTNLMPGAAASPDAGGNMANPVHTQTPQPRRRRKSFAAVSAFVLLALVAGAAFYFTRQDRSSSEPYISVSNPAQPSNAGAQTSQPSLNPAADVQPSPGADQSSGSDQSGLSAGTPAQSPASANQSAGQSIDRQLFTFSLTECRLSGTIVTCDLVITNRDKDRRLVLQHSTQIFDEFGGGYQSRRVEFANQEREARLVSGAPSQVRAVFEGVPLNSRKLALLEVDFFADNNGTAEFRNILLASNNAPVSIASQAGAPRAMQSVDVQLITFALTECRLASSIVTCVVVLTNKDSDKRFVLQRGSQIADEAGNSYTCRRTQVANQESEIKLITDIPTTAKLVFEGVSPQARRISKLEVGFFADNNGKAEFRDIPLISGR